MRKNATVIVGKAYSRNNS